MQGSIGSERREMNEVRWYDKEKREGRRRRDVFALYCTVELESLLADLRRGEGGTGREREGGRGGGGRERGRGREREVEGRERKRNK